MDINTILDTLKDAVKKKGLSKDAIQYIKEDIIPFLSDEKTQNAYYFISSADKLLSSCENPHFDNIEMAKFLITEAEKKGGFEEDLIRIVSRENSPYDGGLNDKERGLEIYNRYVTSLDKSNFSDLYNSALLATECFENSEIALKAVKEFTKFTNTLNENLKLLSLCLKLDDSENSLKLEVIHKCLDLAEDESDLYQLQGDIQDLVGEYDYSSDNFSEIRNPEAYNAWLKIKQKIENLNK